MSTKKQEAFRIINETAISLAKAGHFSLSEMVKSAYTRREDEETDWEDALKYLKRFYEVYSDKNGQIPEVSVKSSKRYLHLYKEILVPFQNFLSKVQQYRISQIPTESLNKIKEQIISFERWFSGDDSGYYPEISNGSLNIKNVASNYLADAISSIVDILETRGKVKYFSEATGKKAPVYEVDPKEYVNKNVLPRILEFVSFFEKEAERNNAEVDKVLDTLPFDYPTITYFMKQRKYIVNGTDSSIASLVELIKNKRKMNVDEYYSQMLPKFEVEFENFKRKIAEAAGASPKTSGDEA